MKLTSTKMIGGTIATVLASVWIFFNDIARTFDSPVRESAVAWVDDYGESEILTLYSELSAGDKNLEYLVIHCTATPPNNTWGPEELKAFFHHVRGWSRPGYLFYITYDGRIHPLWNANIDGVVEYGERTYGAQGYNSVSIHIAYQGGVSYLNKARDTRTIAQKKSIESVIKIVKNAVPTVKVVGHRDLSPDRNGDGKITKDEWMKDCPSFEVKDEF